MQGLHPRRCPGVRTETCLLPILEHLAILFDLLIPTSPASEREKLPLRSSRHINPEALLRVNLPVDTLTVNFNNAILDLLLL